MHRLMENGIKQSNSFVDDSILQVNYSIDEYKGFQESPVFEIGLV